MSFWVFVLAVVTANLLTSMIATLLRIIITSRNYKGRLF